MQAWKTAFALKRNYRFSLADFVDQAGFIQIKSA